MNSPSPHLARAEGSVLSTLISPRILPRILTGLLAAWPYAVGCSRADPSAASEAPQGWPAGAVLVLDGVPILPDEVDEVASDFALLEPQISPLQLRRIALSRSIFPRISARGIDPARRSEAEALASSYREALEAGTLPAGPLAGPMEIERSGNPPDLGFEVWRTALHLEPGRWSQVIETPGSFHVLRVKSRQEGPHPGLTRWTLGAFHFPYLDPDRARAEIETALDRSRLTVLDETWRDAVPAVWRYRFHAESP